MVKKLEDLVDQKYQLINVLSRIEEEEQEFQRSLQNLKTQFISTANPEGRITLTKKAELLYLEFEKKINDLTNKSREIITV